MLRLELVSNVIDAVSFAFGMFWEILWALILGFALSAVVQAVVSKQEMRRRLPDDCQASSAITTDTGHTARSRAYPPISRVHNVRGQDT